MSDNEKPIAERIRRMRRSKITLIAPRDQIHALIQQYAEQRLAEGIDWIDLFRDIMAREPATWDDAEKRFVRTVAIYGVQAFIDRFVDDRIDTLEMLED